MPIAGQGLIFPQIDRFRKLFALLDPKTSNCQNHHIYNFHASRKSDRHPHPKIKKILYIGEAGGRGEALGYFPNRPRYGLRCRRPLKNPRMINASNTFRTSELLVQPQSTTPSGTGPGGSTIVGLGPVPGTAPGWVPHPEGPTRNSCKPHQEQLNFVIVLDQHFVLLWKKTVQKWSCSWIEK